MFFKHIFYFCSLELFCAFAWLRFCAFWCFRCFFFVKKNKKFKTTLIPHLYYYHLNLEFDLIAVIVQFFKAEKLFFRYDDVIMASRLVVQVTKVGVLQF